MFLLCAALLLAGCASRQEPEDNGKRKIVATVFPGRDGRGGHPGRAGLRRQGPHQRLWSGDGTHGGWISTSWAIRGEVTLGCEARAGVQMFSDLVTLLPSQESFSLWLSYCFLICSQERLKGAGKNSTC